MDKKNIKPAYIIIAVVLIVVFMPVLPFLLPLIIAGIVIYAVKKGNDAAPKNERAFRSQDNFRSDIYENTYEEKSEFQSEADGNSDGFNFDDVKETLNKVGKNLTDFARSTKADYESSSLKPKVDRMSGRLKEEFSVRDKDDADEAEQFIGTYDEKAEEIKGLKTLLSAGIIEKDEYNDRLREINERFS